MVDKPSAEAKDASTRRHIDSDSGSLRFRGKGTVEEVSSEDDFYTKLAQV